MNASFAAVDIAPGSDFSLSAISQTIYREVDMGYLPAWPKPGEKPEQRISIQPAWFTFINPLEFE